MWIFGAMRMPMKIVRRIREQVAALLREPLVHFLLLGAAIYGVYGLAADPVAEDSENTIRITAGEIDWLATSWQKRWNRPPTPAERDGLVQEYIRETVLYREALAMGLDRDDTIIRRRLAQKLEFLTDDLAALAQPSEAELTAYFQANADRYRDPALITFTHVFVDPDRRGDRSLADAEAIKAELASREPEDGDALGDPFLLQRYYPERTEDEVAKLFGRGFAKPLFELAPEQWHGPVLSGYGIHLVWVHHREDSREASFAAVRDRVRQDWEDARRRELKDAFYAGLRQRYEVIVEEPEPGDDFAAVEVRLR
jgi:hypothetical protein